MTLANHDNAAMMETVLVHGNLKDLTPAARMDYYRMVCESLGLNPLTKPFQYITFQNRLVLYASKDCTEQLSKIHGVSTRIDEGREVRGTWIFRCTATDKDGRTTDSTGAAPIEGLTGEALSNAFMKAETKAKRRAVLSICGLGMLDASETDSIHDAQTVHVDENGVILDQPPAARTNAQIAPGIAPESAPGAWAWAEWAAGLTATLPEEFDDLLESMADDPRAKKVVLVQAGKGTGDSPRPQDGQVLLDGRARGRKQGGC